MFITLFSTHIFTFLLYASGIYYDVQPPPGSEFESIFKESGGRFKFLTFLNMVSLNDDNYIYWMI